MYLNLIQIAESFGVSEKTVEDWIRHEGLPHTPDRGRLLFDRTQVTNWAVSRGLVTRAGFLAAGDPTLTTGVQLAPLLRTGGIWRDVAPAALAGVYEKIGVSLPGVTPPIRQLLVQRLRAPGGVTLAPVGGGFAVPHPSVRVALGRDSGAVALLLLSEPLVAETSPDGEPVSRLFFFIAPSPRAHLDVLGRICRVLRPGPVRDAILRGAGDEEIYQAIAAADLATAGNGTKEAIS